MMLCCTVHGLFGGVLYGVVQLETLLRRRVHFLSGLEGSKLLESMVQSLKFPAETELDSGMKSEKKGPTGIDPGLDLPILERQSHHFPTIN